MVFAKEFIELEPVGGDIVTLEVRLSDISAVYVRNFQCGKTGNNVVKNFVLLKNGREFEIDDVSRDELLNLKEGKGV